MTRLALAAIAAALSLAAIAVVVRHQPVEGGRGGSQGGVVPCRMTS